jgi:hypothetical protein
MASLDHPEVDYGARIIDLGVALLLLHVAFEAISWPLAGYPVSVLPLVPFLTFFGFASAFFALQTPIALLPLVVSIVAVVLLGLGTLRIASRPVRLLILFSVLAGWTIALGYLAAIFDGAPSPLTSL